MHNPILLNCVQPCLKKNTKIAELWLKAFLIVNTDGDCLINCPWGWRAARCSRGVWRESRRQRAAVWARWKGRASPPVSETRANRPWQKPTNIKGPINPQLLRKGGRGRRETRSFLNGVEPPRAGGSWGPGPPHRRLPLEEGS